MLLLGYTFKVAIVDPLIRHGVIPLVIATLGLSIGLKQVVKAGVQRAGRTVSKPFSGRPARARNIKDLLRRHRHPVDRRH